MAEAGLLAVRAQGRNRFFRLATPDVAHAMEALMAVAGARAAPASQNAAWRRDPDLRFCRTCYDHLAGQVGMAVTDSLTRGGHLEPQGQRDWQLTPSGELFCQRLGVDLPGARRAGTRHFARQCLDWSERRPHISGALGAAIADTFFTKGWAERLRRGRVKRKPVRTARALLTRLRGGGVIPGRSRLGVRHGFGAVRIEQRLSKPEGRILSSTPLAGKTENARATIGERIRRGCRAARRWYMMRVSSKSLGAIGAREGAQDLDRVADQAVRDERRSRNHELAAGTRPARPISEVGKQCFNVLDDVKRRVVRLPDRPVRCRHAAR